MTEVVVERTELLPGPALAFGALLDVPVPDLDSGEGLPLLWHWIYHARDAFATAVRDIHGRRTAVGRLTSERRPTGCTRWHHR